MKLSATIPGRPVGASRPRVARNGGVFYPAAHRRWQAMAVAIMRKIAHEHRANLPFPKTEPVIVFVEIIANRLVITPDVDNVAKLALDSAVKAGWLIDDSQVAKLVVERRVRGKKEDQSVTLTMVSWSW